MDIGLFQSLEAFSHTGEDAGEDNSGIAAGSQEHSSGDSIGHLSQRVSTGGSTGLNGHIHIVSRVSVRDGEDIEVIDFLAALGQAGGSATDEVQV